MYTYKLFDENDALVFETKNIREVLWHPLYHNTVVENDCITKIGEREFPMFETPIAEYDGVISSTDEQIAGQSINGRYYCIFYRKTSVNNFMHYCVESYLLDSQMAFNGMALNPEHGIVLIDGHYCRAMTETEEIRWNEDNQYVPHDLWGNYVIL